MSPLAIGIAALALTGVAIAKDSCVECHSAMDGKLKAPGFPLSPPA